VAHPGLQVGCPCCGGRSNALYAASDWNQSTSTESFNYRRCDACGLTFLHPLPGDLRRYYINEQYDIPSSTAGFAARAQTQRWKVDLLDSLVQPGRLLEIGPATGEFAFAARAGGYAPRVIEMDPDCCRFMRELGVEVVHSDAPADELDDGAPYRAICIWQAIEHIPRFWVLIERACQRLMPGGVLVLSTPNPISVQARLLGRFWPHLDAPRHLYLIPPQWMQSFARQHGMQVALKTTRDVGSLGLNYYGWLLAVRHALRGGGSARTVDFLTRWLTSLFGPLERREGWGCSYTVALRK
jgi:2-polyprenyl-3-methyl-5-hydroxy-6-metoxy-1,4-benzoquinol methylase